MSEHATTGNVPEWTLGWRLQRALAYADIPVGQIARELDVSRATISRWINDRGARPRTIYLKQWALRCGVPYEWLSTGVYAGQRDVRNQWFSRQGKGVGRAA